MRTLWRSREEGDGSFLLFQMRGQRQKPLPQLKQVSDQTCQAAYSLQDWYFARTEEGCKG